LNRNTIPLSRKIYRLSFPVMLPTILGSYLVLTLPGGTLWAIEIKRSSAPRPERGFYSACADLEPNKRFIVYPGRERFPLDEHTEAIGIASLAQLLNAAK
jgi:hypothetical protein